MAIGVDCPCGKSISDWADNVPYLADFLPEQHSDAYCGAIEDAIRQHPGDSEITEGLWPTKCHGDQGNTGGWSIKLRRPSRCESPIEWVTDQ